MLPQHQIMVFWSSTGVPQGDPISALGFSAGLEVVFKAFGLQLAETLPDVLDLHPCYMNDNMDDSVLLPTRTHADTVLQIVEFRIHFL